MPKWPKHCRCGVLERPSGQSTPSTMRLAWKFSNRYYLCFLFWFCCLACVKLGWPEAVVSLALFQANAFVFALSAHRLAHCSGTAARAIGRTYGTISSMFLPGLVRDESEGFSTRHVTQQAPSEHRRERALCMIFILFSSVL